MKPIVAIVGRPNVGKSSLFNKITGTRTAIVDDMPGVTRDRIYGVSDWNGISFTLIDTGGIEPYSKEVILSQMRSQAKLAIDMAEVILFVVDVREGMTAADKDVAAMLQKSGKKVLLVCNKADNPGKPPMEIYEFYNLGLGEPYAVSSVHGLGIGDLLDDIVSEMAKEEEEEADDGIIKIAVIGKPNVGKSSLVNRMLNEDRMIVSDIAGTTRDAVDSQLIYDGQEYTIIDTAGMRKRGKVDEGVERYSVLRSLAAVDRCDVCLIMIDAVEGVTEQDTKVAGYAHEQGKGCIVVINKWDLVEKDGRTYDGFVIKVKEALAFMLYAPIIAISALTGKRVNNLYGMINSVYRENNRRITTGTLNDCINEAIAIVQPPSDKGRRLKIYYITQASTKPPFFVVFVNNAELAHFSYMRYLENKIRENFGFVGTPIRFSVREKE